MWWDDYPKRLNKEINALNKNYPGLSLVLSGHPSSHCTYCGAINAENKHFVVFAEIETRLGCQYPVEMIYPCNFPNHIPSVWLKKALDPKAPSHQYRDGRLCLTDKEVNPAISGVMVLTWAYGWLNCYDIWRKTGHFPSKNYGRHRV